MYGSDTEPRTVHDGPSSGFFGCGRPTAITRARLQVPHYIGHSSTIGGDQRIRLIPTLANHGVEQKSICTLHQPPKPVGLLWRSSLNRNARLRRYVSMPRTDGFPFSAA
jgi:hypothetical protein